LSAILKQLKGHRNIIELIEVIDEPNAPKLYIVMELANGCSLQQLTESAPNNRLPHQQAREYFRQLVEGLEFMHSRNVVHRDIKPSNLMLTTKGELKISDFGVAEFLDRYAELDLVTRSTVSIVRVSTICLIYNSLLRALLLSKHQKLQREKRTFLVEKWIYGLLGLLCIIV
jgi:serine/threonine protein kinase